MECPVYKCKGSLTQIHALKRCIRKRLSQRKWVKLACWRYISIHSKTLAGVFEVVSCLSPNKIHSYAVDVLARQTSVGSVRKKFRFSSNSVLHRTSSSKADFFFLHLKVRLTFIILQRRNTNKPRILVQVLTFILRVHYPFWGKIGPWNNIWNSGSSFIRQIRLEQCYTAPLLQRTQQTVSYCQVVYAIQQPTPTLRFVPILFFNQKRCEVPVAPLSWLIGFICGTQSNSWGSVVVKVLPY